MSFFFDRLGVVEATHSDAKRDPESDAIEAGAQNLEPLDGEEIPEGHVGTRFLSEVKDLATVSNWLSKAGWKVLASEIRYVAKNPVELGDADKQQVSGFLNDIDDHDDVHRLYVAMK
jgi:transcriptional/translational regulatory protein YebC/TACO1